MTDAWPTGSFDVLRKDLVVVFCGLNPSVEAAATGHNFGSASNRFWTHPDLAVLLPGFLIQLHCVMRGGIALMQTD